MINNRYFPNSFFCDHLILINFSAIFAYIVHKIKFMLLYMGRISRSLNVDLKARGMFG